MRSRLLCAERPSSPREPFSGNLKVMLLGEPKYDRVLEKTGGETSVMKCDDLGRSE